MLEQKIYISESAQWAYEDMLGFYKSGAISAERMAEYVAFCDQIEAEYLVNESNKAA